MTDKSIHKAGLYALGVISLSIWALLLWDHFHGGVPSHHLLAKKELPKISNWWGAITVPLASYLLLNRIKKRIPFENGFTGQNSIKYIAYPFLIALIYAVTIAVSFTTGNPQISTFLFQGLFVIAIFFPIYKAEYFLGFILGLVYAFGGVLPIMISSFLAIISYLLYNFLRPVFIRIGVMAGLVKKT